MDLPSLAAGTGNHGAATPAPHSVPDGGRTRAGATNPAQAARPTPPAPRTPPARALEFSVDAATGRPLVRVLDTDTGEVVRQIPGDESLALARALDQLQGRRLDTKA